MVQGIPLSEQVLNVDETTGREFYIEASALVSVEGIVVRLASGAALTAAISLTAFLGARQLSFEIVGGDASGGSIAIAGTDAEGNAQTETLTFTMASQTLTTTHAYIASGLTATPATFTQGGVDVDATVLGNWLVQSSRRDANPRFWLDEFAAGAALTASLPFAEIQGAPSRAYQVISDNPGVECYKDDVYDEIWK